MAAITLEIAEKKLQTWLEAEEEVTTSQSYSIGTRTLTRANLKEIREQIDYWDNKVKRLRGGRNRVYRVVPRDL